MFQTFDFNPMTWPPEWQVLVGGAALLGLILGFLFGRAGRRRPGYGPQRGAYADYGRDERRPGPSPQFPGPFEDRRARFQGGEDGEGWEDGEGGERGRKRKKSWDFDD
jgi:hypothetical protein